MESENAKGGYGKARLGTDIDWSVTYENILEADGPNPPFMLASRGTHQPKPGPIPYERYTDPKYVEFESEFIWKKHWQVACREEDIPNVGDRIVYEVCDQSYIIVRTAPDKIKAYHNSCRHRGRKLCDGPGSGENFRCPYHAWTWNLDGELVWVPTAQDFPHVTPEKYALPEVRVGVWGGNVFINPDPDAPALEAALGVLVEQFKDFPLEDRYTVLHVRRKIRANWKVAQEAFMESYHVLETHWDGMPFFGSAYTQYDCWDDGVSHVNRLVTPSVVPDAFLADKVSPEESLMGFCKAFGLPLPEEGTIKTIAQARRFAADARRRQLEATTGHDLADLSIGTLLDMNKSFMFPNFHPWWGEALPWWYRFLPIGNSADECVMEVRVTQRVPKHGPRPAPAKPIDIDFDEKGVDYPETGILGYIMDQDVSNLQAMQQGFKAAKKGLNYLTLGRYQECNIAHFHEVYARKLEAAEKRSKASAGETVEA